ncbi:MAG: hypothetical protein AAGD00_00085 [Planctomycetota bacterium]
MSSQSPLRAAARPVVITSLVTALAGLTLGGCSSSKSAQFRTGENITRDTLAAQSDITIDPAAATGSVTEADYNAMAQQVNLPTRWVSEAQEQTASTEARRASAQAYEVIARNNMFEEFANADADMQRAIAEATAGEATADKWAEVYAARMSEIDAATAAQEFANIADAERADRFLHASELEWQSEVDRLEALADAEWQQAQATYGKMLAEREGVENRGNASIQQMSRVAQLTEARAQAKLAQIHQEAQSIQQQTSARASELEEQISTTSERFTATVRDLRQQASSLGDVASANVSQWRAEAQSLTEQGVEQTYNLSMEAADARFQSAEAESQRLYQIADATEMELDAEVTRRLADAEQQRTIDFEDYQAAQQSIETFVETGKAEISLLRVNAETIEREARADFVAAEAEARAEAIRERSLHQFVLAESEFARIKSQAEAEATRRMSSFYEAIAQKESSNDVTLDANIRPGTTEIPSSDTPEPEFAEVDPKTPYASADYIAKFETSLAEVSRLRRQAEAQENALLAEAGNRLAQFRAWFEGREARHTEALAAAGTFKAQKRAEINEAVRTAETLMAKATAQFDRQSAEAEADRREAIASIAKLSANADTEEKKAHAMTRQLIAQADAAERNGQSEVRALQAQLAAVRQRGQARVAKLQTEASAYDQTQRAVVAQMRQEIEAARQVLNAELARLEQSSTSFFQIAEATFDEAVSQASTLASIYDATSEEFAAANQAQAEIAMADVEYQREMNGVNSLLADAAIARMVADNEHTLALNEAGINFNRAQTGAEVAIALASVEEQFRIANTEDDATFGQFNARIAQTNSERNRALAAQYLANFHDDARLRQARAAANAYNELTNNALAVLNQQEQDFNIAAQQNWYSRLALTAPFPTPNNPNQLKSATQPTFVNFQQPNGTNPTFNNQPIFNNSDFNPNTFNNAPVFTDVPVND